MLRDPSRDEPQVLQRYALGAAQPRRQTYAPPSGWQLRAYTGELMLCTRPAANRAALSWQRFTLAGEIVGASYTDATPSLQVRDVQFNGTKALVEGRANQGGGALQLVDCSPPKPRARSFASGQWAAFNLAPTLPELDRPWLIDLTFAHGQPVFQPTDAGGDAVQAPHLPAALLDPDHALHAAENWHYRLHPNHVVVAGPGLGVHVYRLR